MSKLEKLKKKMEEAQAAWNEADALRENAETALYKAGVAWDNAEKAYEKELNKGKKEKIYNLDPAKLHAIKQEVVKEKIYNLDPAAFTPIFKGESNE
jgi:Skp family chaperone for outer membrane proteins